MKDTIRKLFGSTYVMYQALKKSVALFVKCNQGINWEAGRRRPPEYIPRLISYQLKYEELIGKKQKEEQDAEK